MIYFLIAYETTHFENGTITSIQLNNDRHKGYVYCFDNVKVYHNNDLMWLVNGKRPSLQTPLTSSRCRAHIPIPASPCSFMKETFLERNI